MGFKTSLSPNIVSERSCKISAMQASRDWKDIRDWQRTNAGDEEIVFVYHVEAGLLSWQPHGGRRAEKSARFDKSIRLARLAAKSA